MTENSFTMQSFRHSIYLDKPVSEIYKYIGTADGLTKWFIGSSVYESPEGEKRKFDEHVHKGDEFDWEWLEKDLDITGKVLEAEANSLFKFTFGSLFVVTITLKEDKGRTLFTLTQEYEKNVSQNDFAHINCCVCWGFFITNLKSVVEFGNDLREIEIKNEELVNR